jgi:hypothetical protein
MAAYLFSIVSDFPNGVVDPEAFRLELIEDFTFDEPLGVGTTGDVVVVSTADDLTPEQLITLDAAVAAHQGTSRAFERKHFEEEFDGPRLVRETWWARVLTGGVTFSKKVTERLYAYKNGNRLMKESYTEFNPNGSVLRVRNWVFKTVKDGTTTRVLKVEQ